MAKFLKYIYTYMQQTNVTTRGCSLQNETQLLVGLSSQGFGIPFAKVLMWSHLLCFSQEVPVIYSVW